MRPRALSQAGTRLLGALAATVALALALAPAAGARFQLGLDAPLAGERAAATLRAAHYTHASIARVVVSWANVAPSGRSKPAGFDASNPADPRYDWSNVDASVLAAHRAGMAPLLTLYRAPSWAEGPGRASAPGGDLGAGAWDPSPREYAAFATAAARRYSGSFIDSAGRALPRVSLWEAWNEENLPVYFDAYDPIGHFRRLVNSFYDAVKAVKPTNTVIVGGLAPVSYLGRSTSPLAFAAGLMCLSRVSHHFVRTPGCHQRLRFDVLAHHPYSLAATPTKHAYHYDDVLVNDMYKLDRLLRTADRLHTVVPAGERHRLWVTEFAWFSNPPNRIVGDRPGTAARYVALSLYLLWRAHVQAVVWQTVTDARTASITGGGLYTVGGRPKLMLRAFRFPLYAQVRDRRGYAWGRAPVSTRARVALYWRSAGRWRFVAKGRTASDGVFRLHFRARRNGLFRAHVIHGASSLTYDSRPVPPLRTHVIGKSLG